jgi:hypothetical protein
MKAMLLWERFDLERTKETGGDIKRLQDNPVSLTVPANCTHRYVLEAIANSLQPPLAIESLAQELGSQRLPRGQAIFHRSAGDVIDKIAANYEQMYWWISTHGLNMVSVLPMSKPLSEFDELAGRLYVEGSKNGELADELLLYIAKQLDSAGLNWRELQPKQREKVAYYNQKNSKYPLKTFEDMCVRPTLVRYFKKRLYVARDRYQKRRLPPNQLS